MAAAHNRRAASPSSSSAPGHTAPRKVVPIKHPDGHPLTRADLQFDFLNAVFSDSQAIFTNPYTPSSRSGDDSDHISGTKITFRELYVSAILHSPKATKVLKDKMSESTMFAVDFAMLALLVNVGRVNTTMSFFAGMKTTIRTYHPIPALARTDGNLQDAPRIKHVVKSSLLPTDAKSTPATPGDILARRKAGKRPSTSVTNLIFVLAHHSGPVGQTHFEGQITFLDLFLRTDTSSKSRARIFLWLCYNYLEPPSDSSDSDSNPFSDPGKKHVPPPLTLLTPAEMALENRETMEDLAATDRLQSERNRVVLSQSVKEAMKESAAKASMNGSVVGDEDEDAAVSLVVEDVKGKGRAKKGAASATAIAAAASHAKGKGKRVAPATTTSSKDKKVILTIEKSKAKPPAAMLIPDLDEDEKIDAFIKQRPASVRHFGSEPFQHPSALFTTVPSQLMSRVASDSRSHHSHTRYSPYARQSPSSTSSLSDTRPRPRTMFQQAWHVITSTDPLIDSDNELGGDEYVRDDYLQRLEVIKRFSQQPWSQQPPPPPSPSHPSKIETES